MSNRIIKSKFYFEEDLIETIGSVSDKKYSPLPFNNKLKYIGKEINRKDAKVKVSGKANYTFDVKLPGMVYAKILRSPYANAIIESIDDSRAKKINGVIGVIHAFNTNPIKWYHNSFLFDKHVRYEGDEVACVAATSEQIAEEALKKIKVKYKQLNFEIRAKESINSKLKIHKGGNIVFHSPAKYSRGNIRNGFKEADFIIEEEYSTQVVIHNPTEPHCSVVNWEGNKITIYDSTQGIFRVRKTIANVFGINPENVRVIDSYMGGGFGSKLETGKYTIMAALLARKFKRAVKITNNRREQNLALGNRPDSIQKLKIGFKQDGTITALQHRSYASVGAYPASGNCSWPLRTMYGCKNVTTEDYSVYTNTGRARPFRAPGHVQGTFALEALIDQAAKKIEMDPLEFRLKNFVGFDQFSRRLYTSKLLKEAYIAGAKRIGWDKREELKKNNTKFIKYGMGMASQIWWGGGGPPAHVKLEIDSKGKITAFAGSQDIGTGTYTFVAQVIAEVLEIPPDKIKVVLGDTQKVPYGPSSGGSTTAPSISPACRDAAEKLKSKLIDFAAVLMDENKNNLQYKNGAISTRNGNSKIIGFEEIVKQLNEDKISVMGSREANPDNFVIQSFGAQFAIVAVDILTGNIKVEKIVAAHDIGRTLNRKTLENQFHGGIIQGLGYALMEEQLVDINTGKILNANFHDYKVPTIKDIPDIEVIIVSKNDRKANNTGVKGIGEPAIIPTAAAIANATSHAIGKQITSLPITPEKILNLLYGEI